MSGFTSGLMTAAETATSSVGAWVDLTARLLLALTALALIYSTARAARRLERSPGVGTARRRILRAAPILLAPTALFWALAAFELAPFWVLAWLSRLADFALLAFVLITWRAIVDAAAAMVTDRPRP